MRKKQLKEACACEGEEATTSIRRIRLDDFNRYCLQLTEEEQDTLTFREVIAKMLGTNPKNIGRIRMNNFAYRIEVNGEMNDFDKILDDNKDVLHRLKGADDEEEETSEFDEILDRKTFHHFMQAYANGNLSLDMEVNGKSADAYMTKGNGVCLETSAGKIYTRFIQRVEINRVGNSWEGWISANGFKLRFNAELWEDEDNEDDDLEDLMIGGEAPDTDENGWMTPKEMGIAQKMDWSDDYGDEISDEEKMDYFQSKSDMYDVDMKKGLVRLKPEDEWFGDDEENNMEDWEKEGYNSEIAYQNRWRDYEPESYEDDDDDEDEDRDPYSPFNKDY